MSVICLTCDWGWLQKLASGGPLTLDIFVKANSVYVDAIVLAMVATIFLRETGSARYEPNKPRRAPQT